MGSAEEADEAGWDGFLANDSCDSTIDMEHYLHYSLLPSVIIILVLSCLEKRVRRWPIDGKLNKLYGRGGVVIPFDFVATFRNRWSFGFAFGATADKLMFLFEGEFPQPEMPGWVKVFWVMLIATEVGLSSYPFFACLTTSYQKTGASLGLLYTLSWLVVMLIDVVECPHGEFLHEYEKVILFWPSFLCQLFLLGRFLHILVKSLKIHGGQAILNEGTSFLEDHQMQHVQQLMKKPPPCELPQKSWIQRKLYVRDPYFRFPSRMISTAVVVLICLYMFIMLELIASILLTRILRKLKLEVEDYFARLGILQDLSSEFSKVQEFLDVLKGVWIFTTITTSLMCVTYVFHILACYRKHIKLLRAGKKNFLLPDITLVSHTLTVVALARYSSWQIAYILWGYFTMHALQWLAGMILMYVVILPMIHGQWMELIDKWGTPILSFVIVMAIKHLQYLIASRFFLQPKISPQDKQKPLALDNRKAFQNFTYFLFFKTVVVGLVSCLMRLLRSIVLGSWLIGRLDRPVMPKDYEACDMGFKTWVGMLLMDHYHTNPVLVYFCHILVTTNRERGPQRAAYNPGTELMGKDLPNDGHNDLHRSVVAIITVLSCLEKRPGESPIDEKWPFLRRRCGILIPLDFVDAFINRWSLAFAFGATANKVMILLSEGCLPLQVPKWARDGYFLNISNQLSFKCSGPERQEECIMKDKLQGAVILVCSMEVGLSSYPFFVCISTHFQITGATLGFLYTVSWLTAILMNIAQCPHGQVLGKYEKIIFYWPSLFCLVFLLSRFGHILMRTIWVRLQPHLPSEETSFLKIHQAHYVQQLMRKPPRQLPQKSWIQQKVYEWDPHFRFPSRMVCVAVLAVICLYLFIIIELYVEQLVFEALNILEENFEMLIAARNTSEVPASPVQPLKEFIDVAERVWIFTTFTACLTSVSYVFHILVCYRKHMKRLWAGEKQFLPLAACKLSHSVAAIARYMGWQIAYLVWGYLIVHIVQCIFGLMLMYSFVLPIKHGQGIEAVKSLGTVILTVAITVSLMGLQIVAATRFFLQPKISLDDKEKPLALNNRKAFQNFNYFFFFYNVLLGLSACLFRLLCSVVVGAWLIARIDRTIMPRGYEAADMGFRTWIGMLLMDHYHTNPTLVCFCHILVVQNREQSQQRTTTYHSFSNGTVFRVSKKARTRWLLLYTLLNNPSLSTLRKTK